MTPRPDWVQMAVADLAPMPGRLAITLRMVLATVVSLILLFVWQIPSAPVGLFFVFFISRESPALSFRSSIVSLITVMSAVALEIGVVVLSDNEPLVRVLSVAIVAFVAGMIVLGSNLPQLGPIYGLIFCTLIAFWENPAPSDALVKASLWVLASFAVALGCSVAVEYLFVSPRLAEKLQEQRRIRYNALAAMFGAYARGAAPEEIAPVVLAVQRLAATGQRGMQSLYEAIVERDLNTGTLPPGSRVRITMLAQLMDDAAAFGTHNDSAPDARARERCARIAAQFREMMDPVIGEEAAGSPAPPEASAGLPDQSPPGHSLLDHVEETIRVIRTMPVATGDKSDQALVYLPAQKAPFWHPGALTDRATVTFALKVSFCATICYVFYHAVDWPGISTAVTTVFVSAVGPTGAINQKIAYRVVGALIGGFLAIGSAVFVFPYIDSITSLVAIVAAVAFISGWIAAGRTFSYVGTQIAFSFYIVAFEGFSAPTQLAPSRDRLIGILVALVVIWFVFDQLWPVRTVTAMRQSLASVLRQQAALLRLAEQTADPADRLRTADAMRDHVAKTVAGLRTMNDTVLYEFGANIEEHRRSGEMIVAAALKAVAMFWNQLAVFHREEDRDFLGDRRLAAMRLSLADRLDIMAQAVTGKTGFEKTDTLKVVDAEVLASPRYGEYAHNTTARFEELQTLVADLNMQPV